MHKHCSISRGTRKKQKKRQNTFYTIFEIIAIHCLQGGACMYVTKAKARYQIKSESWSLNPNSSHEGALTESLITKFCQFLKMCLLFAVCLSANFCVVVLIASSLANAKQTLHVYPVKTYDKMMVYNLDFGDLIETLETKLVTIINIRKTIIELLFYGHQ